MPLSSFTSKSIIIWMIKSIIFFHVSKEHLKLSENRKAKNKFTIAIHIINQNQKAQTCFCSNIFLEYCQCCDVYPKKKHTKENKKAKIEYKVTYAPPNPLGTSENCVTYSILLSNILNDITQS